MRCIMKRTVAVLVMVAMVVGFAGCATRSQTGAAVGAGSGAVVGGLIGRAAGNTAAGAIIGAAVGGAAGAVIGNYMDRQAAEMERDIEGAKIERIGEGIKITFDSGILFAYNSAELASEARLNLTRLATILNKYDDTDILLEGHTDSDGAADYNMGLSRRRAQSVNDFLVGLEVASPRFTVKGYGEEQPIATNDTAEGKALNRRVEVAIMANDDLKAAARRQSGEMQ
jgi:outer membrane protein OmpA-like peptidoglycan-associated protein